MKILWLFLTVFLLRLALATTIFNNDVINHEVWANSVAEHGWLGLYSRDVSPWAQVNYPPLTLYTFKWGHDLYASFPFLNTSQLEAFFYKLPSLFADLGIALILFYFAPFKKKWRLGLSLLFLFNPALIYNSVFWGQVESWVTFWCVLTGILLVKNRGELAVIAFTLALLSKQNAAPLAPLFLMGLYLARPQLGKLVSAILLSLGIAYLSYAPILGSLATIPGIITNYISSLAGQTHQHLGSVNALNLWYLLGFNKIEDTGIRVWSNLATVIALATSLWYYWQHRKNHYQAFFTSSAILYLGIFLFTTRMHERHLYMALAFMTFVLPYSRSLILYGLLSLLSFYNQYIVWAEFMAVAPMKEVIWLGWTKFLSLISVVSGFIYSHAVFRKAGRKI